MADILLVEDELALGKLVEEALTHKSFKVQLARNGLEAVKLFKEKAPDICVLDVMLPGIDGFSLAKEFKKINEAIPILFLTARLQTSDVIKGYASGGNDYLKKPFSIDELVLRIHELLKRYNSKKPVENEYFALGVYDFYPVAQILRMGDMRISLSHKESALLKEFVLEKNNVIERKKLLNKLWGEDNFFNGRNMDVYIVKLRKLLKEDKKLSIINIRGIGYKLVDETSS